MNRCKWKNLETNPIYIEDKCGEWELITMLDGKELAHMKFNLYNTNT